MDVTEVQTVFAIIPAAPAAATAAAAFRALPLGSNARLTGLHISPIGIRYGLAADMVLASYIEAQIAAGEEERAAAAAAFSAACEQAGVAFEWRADRALDYLVSAHAGALARAADLIVYPRLAEGASIGRHDVEEAVFASGRPVIALPTGWTRPALGRRVLVAWDSGREATRAVFDTLPLLVHAEAVRIVSVQGFLDEPVRQFTPADDLCATLSRHGVPVEALTFRSTRGSVKEELEAQALNFAADLTVMGCYGHSRFRERILGGVSRDMLKEIPFPVLLAS
jgi:nucleotide-binding universal stress UspA family protein